MKPVTQTVFGYPHGNCYASCVASILEIPRESCPVISPGKDADETAAIFNEAWGAWFRERGLGRLIVGYSPEYFPRGWTIMVGRSPRDLAMENGEYAKHAVVGLDGEFAHDPHPSRAFFDGHPVEEMEVIYALDPRRIDISAEGAR